MGKRKKKKERDWVMVYTHNEQTTSLPPPPKIELKKNVLQIWVKKLIAIYKLIN